MPCEILVGERWHSGLVLDLSANGLFVQTNAKPRHRERLELRTVSDWGERLEVVVEVARLRRTPPSLVAVARGGIGVRIVMAPEEYYQFVARQTGAPSRLDFAVETGDSPRFRVRVRERDGSRSRRIEVSAADSEAARTRALEESGEGWKILAVERVETDAHAGR